MTSLHRLASPRVEPPIIEADHITNVHARNHAQYPSPGGLNGGCHDTRFAAQYAALNLLGLVDITTVGVESRVDHSYGSAVPGPAVPARKTCNSQTGDYRQSTGGNATDSVAKNNDQNSQSIV